VVASQSPCSFGNRGGKLADSERLPAWQQPRTRRMPRDPPDYILLLIPTMTIGGNVYCLILRNSGGTRWSLTRLPTISPNDEGVRTQTNQGYRCLGLDCGYRYTFLDNASELESLSGKISEWVQVSKRGHRIRYPWRWSHARMEKRGPGTGIRRP
jgi:hypothetical protein